MKILIKQVRNANKLSLDELERLTGVSRSALSRYENEEVSIRIDVLEKIAKGLEMDITDLYEVDESYLNVKKECEE